MRNEKDWDAVELEEHEAEESRVTPETRRKVLTRDEWRCRNCGEMDLSKLTVHHVVFRSQGGGHHADNLVTVCWKCHRQIHDKILTVVRVEGHWFFGNRHNWRRRLYRSRNY